MRAYYRFGHVYNPAYRVQILRCRACGRETKHANISKKDLLKIREAWDCECGGEMEWVGWRWERA